LDFVLSLPLVLYVLIDHSLVHYNFILNLLLLGSFLLKLFFFLAAVAFRVEWKLALFPLADALALLRGSSQGGLHLLIACNDTASLGAFLTGAERIVHSLDVLGRPVNLGLLSGLGLALGVGAGRDEDNRRRIAIGLDVDPSLVLFLVFLVPALSVIWRLEALVEEGPETLLDVVGSVCGLILVEDGGPVGVDVDVDLVGVGLGGARVLPGQLALLHRRLLSRHLLP